MSALREWLDARSVSKHEGRVPPHTSFLIGRLRQTNQ